MDNEKLYQKKSNFFTLFYPILLCVLSLFCLFLAGAYWLCLIGLYPGGLWRFDTMSVPWRALCTLLAVIYPVASCGLWLQSRWGILIWFMAALIETTAYTFYSDVFLWLPLLGLVHFVFLVLLVLCGVANFYILRKAPDQTVAY